MLSKPSPLVEECLQHAADCDLKAEAITNSKAKRNFIIMLADHWRKLAELHEHIARTDAFLNKTG